MANATFCHVIASELFASNWSRMVAVPVVCALSFVNSVELLSKRAVNLRVPWRSPNSSLPRTAPVVASTPLIFSAISRISILDPAVLPACCGRTRHEG